MSVHRLTTAIAGTTGSELKDALTVIAADAGGRDREPRFPSEAFAALAAAGVPQLAGARESCDLGTEVRIVREVARADASCARILDGHFNGV